MQAGNESRKRYISAFDADPDCLISKRMRRCSPPPPPPSFSNPFVPVSSSNADRANNSEVADDFPTDGAQWVEVFANEMMMVADMNDARNRALRLLAMFEKSVTKCNVAQTAERLQEEQKKLKEQMDSLLGENGILKRAVATQHERIKEYGDKVKELDDIKQTYQEKIRTLELNNYTLAMHLQRAQLDRPISGHFNHDIF